MEGNKDEALRCLEIARNAFAEGKFDRAEKFLLKAEKLYETKDAKELLEKLKGQNKENRPGTEGSTGAYNRHEKKSAPTSETNDHTSPSYNGFQFNGYSRGIDSDFTPEEIFSMFFGGGLSQQNVTMRQRNQPHNNNQDVQKESKNKIKKVFNGYTPFHIVLIVAVIFFFYYY